MPRQRILIGSAIVLALIGALVFVLRVDGKTGKPNAKLTTEMQTNNLPPPVQIIVTKLTPIAGRYVYRYRVVNGGAFPITSVLVGSRYQYGNELTYAPMGWDGSSVPTGSYKAPPGWSFQNITTEDDSVGHLQWNIMRPSEAILGGTSVSGFEVTLDEVDEAYENGYWTVYLDSAEEPVYSAGLQPGAVTSVPMSSVFARSDLKISPNPATRAVGIQFSVSTPGKATVDLFDVQGRRVRTVLNKEMAAGSSSISWDGRDEAGKEVSAGIYFARVKTPDGVRFAKFTWLR